MTDFGDFETDAQTFSQRELFWPPEEAEKTLGLTNLPRKSSILDIGCGKGSLVERLEKQGLNAIGIDFYKTELSQKPDISAHSTHLPFADNSFDTVVSFWGGLSYPLYDLESFINNPEQVKSAVVSFLSSLGESLRVAKSEVKIHPWSLHHLFETSGLVALYHTEFTDKLAFLAIDFADLFRKMGVRFETGPVSERPTKGYTGALRHETITIKADSVDLKPLEELIAKFQSSENPLILTSEALADNKNCEGFSSSLKEIMIRQGILNQFQEERESLQAQLEEAQSPTQRIAFYRNSASTYNKNLDQVSEEEAKRQIEEMYNSMESQTTAELQKACQSLQKKKNEIAPLLL